MKSGMLSNHLKRSPLSTHLLSVSDLTYLIDVYSYGIILWEIYTRKHPFDEYKYTFMSQLEQMVASGKRPTIPADCLPEFANLIQRCWDQARHIRHCCPFYVPIATATATPHRHKHGGMVNARHHSLSY